MDLGFGGNVNKAFRKMMRSAKEARKRKEAGIEAGRVHEMGLEQTKQKGAMYQEALRGQYGLAERGMAEQGAGSRAQLQYGPESTEAQRFRMERQWKPTEIAQKARRKLGAVDIPTYDEIGMQTGKTPGLIDLESGQLTRGFEVSSKPSSTFNLQDYLPGAAEKKKKKKPWEGEISISSKKTWPELEE